MKAGARAAMLILLLGGTLSLAGCPGLPGSPGQQQTMPPGVLPPPGLESGGARTLMGTTITPPDNNFLLVRYREAGAPSEQASWQSCRRLMLLENSLLIEGLNHDGRNEQAERDVNRLLPYADLAEFTWKYEPRPTPPAEAEGGGGGG